MEPILIAQAEAVWKLEDDEGQMNTVKKELENHMHEVRRFFCRCIRREGAYMIRKMMMQGSVKVNLTRSAIKAEGSMEDLYTRSSGLVDNPAYWLGKHAAVLDAAD